MKAKNAAARVPRCRTGAAVSRRQPSAARVLLVAAALGLMLVRSASAADLAFKTPPASDWSWTGLYAGFHAGYGWAVDSTGTATSAFTSSSISPFEPATLPLNSSGAVAGVQLGYNWQFAPRWVVGIEGDISATGLKATQTASTTSGMATCTVPGTACGSVTMTQDVNWLAAARGRLGYVFGPGLAYVTGGAAFANVGDKANATQVFPVASTSYPAAANTTKPGWVLGAGYEFMLGNDWTLRAEYLHYGFDSVSATTGPVFPGPVAVGGLSATYVWSPLKIDIMRLGLDYKF
jgi:outer membrane immunogenic protein